MSVEDGDERESFLQTLNSCISTLSFPPMTPVKHAMYAAGCVITYMCKLVVEFRIKAVLFMFIVCYCTFITRSTFQFVMPYIIDFKIVSIKKIKTKISTLADTRYFQHSRK